MKNFLVALLILSLAACGIGLSDEEIERGDRLCRTHGGLKKTDLTILSTLFYHCKDESVIGPFARR